MFDLLKKTAVAAAVTIAMVPATASAVTLTLESNGNTTSVSDSATATFSGGFEGFNVAVASATITSGVNNHMLNTTSIETAGIGTLMITAEELGLSDFGAPTLSLSGTGSTSDIGSSVKVSHYIDTGSGWTLIGNVMEFLRANGNSQSDEVGQNFAANGNPFGLRSVFEIVNTQGNTTSNVNSTLVAAVPLPAGGLLLIGALGGLAALRRRKQAA